MSVIFYDICNFNRDDVHFGISLAVAGLYAAETQLLHVHPLASRGVSLGNKAQLPVKGHYLDGEDATVAEPVGTDIEICKHGACIH